MKKILLILPFMVVLFLSVSSCTDWAPQQQNQVSNEPKNVFRRLKQVYYVDKGAVVPQPNVTLVNFILNDSLHGTLVYRLIQQRDTTLFKIPFDNSERIELVHDNFKTLSEIEDGWVVKPGKDLCVGVQGVDVTMVFTTGDTTRFNINGSARCDRSLIPEWYNLDSLAHLLVEENNLKQ
jgi:hypothetical protein